MEVIAVATMLIQIIVAIVIVWIAMSRFVLLQTPADLMKEIVILTMNVNQDSHVEQTIVLQILA